VHSKHNCEVVPYDEVAYWNLRENPNAKLDPEVHATHIQFVETHVKPCDHVLDFGPGVGRMFPAYRHTMHVHGHDISDMYAEKLLERAVKESFLFSFTVQQRVGELPYKDKEFTVAVAISVFLHQRPHNILTVMSELRRVADRVIAISFYDPSKPFVLLSQKEVTSKAYCFNYDYPQIVNEQGWIVTEAERFRNYLMFEYR